MKLTSRSIFLLFTTLFAFSCAPKPTLEVPEAFKKGQDSFHKVCSNCHGSDAMGKHTKAPRLIDEEYLASNFSDDDIREIVLNGTDKMPSQKKNVTSAEITEIIKYLRYSQKSAGLEADEEDDDN
ncbi:MAG: cytochrome c [Nitrospinaceae bacterium]|jgi:mono/diheme cytochrome c family protein|nr:cytochrome c [Nitrospina sp.]MBT5867589.1 cytochrome c [Nitrospinaceae bacterium]